MIQDIEELKRLFNGYQAYLVGSQAVKIVNPEAPLPRDWDVFVTGNILPDLGPFTKTRMGDRRYNELGLDLWRDGVAKYLKEVDWHEKAVCICLKTGCILGTQQFFQGITGNTGNGRRRVATRHPGTGRIVSPGLPGFQQFVQNTAVMDTAPTPRRSATIFPEPTVITEITTPRPTGDAPTIDELVEEVFGL